MAEEALSNCMQTFLSSVAFKTLTDELLYGTGGWNFFQDKFQFQSNVPETLYPKSKISNRWFCIRNASVREEMTSVTSR